MMVSKRPLLNALQKSQIDAIQLIRREMTHHALCYRSIHSQSHYSDLLVAALQPQKAKMDDEQRSSLAQNLELILFNIEEAKKEQDLGYASVSRRSIIVIADILESIVETTLGICLLHLDLDQHSIREVTKFKKQAVSERDFKLAVRQWEKSLPKDLSSRADRFQHMIKAFFPQFERPQDFAFLDTVIDDRNRFSHDLIKFSDASQNEPDVSWALSDTDRAFSVASDFLIAIMQAIPGDLESPISPQIA